MFSQNGQLTPPMNLFPTQNHPWRPVGSYSDALIKSSQRLRQRSLSPSPPPPMISYQPNPYKSNLDYYRGRTKSVYEKESLFKEFARNIPLSQQNLWDNANMSSLKKDFRRMLEIRSLSTKTNPSLTDPLRPLTSRTISYRPVSEALGVKHQCRSSLPVHLPQIYVYHRNDRR